MTGVEILAENAVYNTYLPVWLGIIGTTLAVMGFIIMVVAFFTDEIKVGIVCLVIATLGITLAWLGFSDNKNDINYTVYKVTIDDSVSMNEFLDKYEILDQDGRIFIIREKNQGE